MDWTKIKTKHFLFSDLTLLQRGALVTLLCLTAHLERHPTEREMCREVSQGMCKTLASRLQDQCTTLAIVFDKVLEDVSVVHRKRTQNKKRVAKYRVTADCNALHGSEDVTEQIREDKIREDKSKYGIYGKVLLTKKQYKNLLQKYGEKGLARLIDNLDRGIKDRGYKYKDHNRTIQNWAKKDNIGNEEVKGGALEWAKNSTK